ncbi:methyltransferase domain-containing protein [Mesorhizobium sp. Z1-4]|uniref:methyltransferase domain-containing protein n=1 Tax=Mesorhizobium sp. Z1-4 TaxID=2448478 RepID=UPI000FD92D05|nr:methyltransferase domain-containing protein [Mesorhizobium sp. Z1-4]
MDRIFDSDLITRRRLRAFRAATTGADFLLAHHVADLSIRLASVERRFQCAVTLHALSAAPAAALAASGKVESVLRIEPDAAFLAGAPGLVSPVEALPLAPESVDLAISMLSLHETNDTPGLLAQIRKALRPDGLFLAALPGQDTLTELRAALLAAETELTGGASPRVAPFMDVRAAGGLLQRAGFALPVADTETLTIRYDTMFDLMRDLRAMGATSALADRSRKPASRQLFLRAAQIYAERYSDPDGRIRATFSTVWMSGWAPHQSQQKPLRPGSAKASLAEALEKLKPS